MFTVLDRVAWPIVSELFSVFFDPLLNELLAGISTKFFTEVPFGYLDPFLLGCKKLFEFVLCHILFIYRQCAKVCHRGVLLLPLHRAMFVETNPLPAKAALSEMGLIKDYCRPPLCPPEASTHKLVKNIVSSFGEMN